MCECNKPAPACAKDARLSLDECEYLHGRPVWLGVRWLGVPYPRRLAAWWHVNWWLYPSPFAFARRLPRCGCCWPLLVLWRFVRPRFAAALAG